MLPDNKTDNNTTNPLGLAHKKRQVTDINIWIQLFSCVHQHDVTKTPRDAAGAAGLHGIHHEGHEG